MVRAYGKDGSEKTNEEDRSTQIRPRGRKGKELCSGMQLKGTWACLKQRKYCDKAPD